MLRVNNRDPKRLEKIRSLPCCECGQSPRSQAAHSNFGIHGKAKSMKADDCYTIPLCHKCHGQFDKFDMGMNHDESLEWFNKKLAFIDGVLDDQAKGESPLF